MRFSVALALAALIVAAPLSAQVRAALKPMPSPSPTKVVARSGRLVTARTTGGGTQSFNCKVPRNAKRKVCRR